jgi:hypothetical protein
VIPDTLDHATQGELQRYENNYKTLNLITTVLDRNVYDRVAHLEAAHDVWLQLCNTYEGFSEIKSLYRDTYNRQYQTFSQKPEESLDDFFARFESMVSSLCSCGPLVYSDNERAKQLLYALDDSIWGIQITALEESTDFTTLDTEKLFSKLKSHELFRKGRPNHDASFSSKALIIGARVGVANPPTLLTHLIWSLLCLPCVQLLMSSMRACPMTRSPCWRGSSARCTDCTRRGGDLLGAAPRGRSSTPPTSTTTATGTTPAIRVRVRRSTASGTRRRSFRR